MILALVIYLSGGRHLPGKAALTSETGQELPTLSNDERRRVAYLILIIALTVFPCIAYPMIWNIGILFIDGHVSLATSFGGVPASWFNSIDAFASIVVVPPLVALWAWQARRGREPSDVAKIGIGCALTGASALFIVVGCLLAGPDGKVGVIWPILCFIGMGFAFIWYWPVLLALISLSAPQKVNSTLMGASFLALFVGSVIMGWVGSFYDGMTPAAFWTVDAAIGFGGAMLVALLAPMLKRALEPERGE